MGWVISPAAVLVVCTLLIFQPITSSPSSPPSYSQLLATAGRILELARPGADNVLNSRLSKLQDEWPPLFSGVLFGRELWHGVERLAEIQERWTAGPNVSDLCVNHTQLLLQALVQRNKTALSMLDAMGKPSPDIQGFNLNWPGALKECLAVNFINTSSTNSSTMFRGQYCTAGIILDPSSPILSMSVGLCVPDSCSSMDITILIHEGLAELQIPLANASYAKCQDRHGPPLNALAIVAIAVAGVFVLLLVVGTMVDIVIKLRSNWRTRIESLMNTHHYDDLQFHNQHAEVLLLSRLPSTVYVPGLAAKMVMAFSVYTNGAKLLSTKQTSGMLGCVHGIRFLSMTWVVLGHTFVIPIYNASNILGYFTEVLKRWTFQALISASVSVDTFFVLSGLLVAYLSLKEMKRNGGSINWFQFFFHRFWRLTPCYMLVILLYMGLWPYLGSGPLWNPHNPDSDNCKTSWWTNLLYINNFVNLDTTCLGQSWYLANDMQFYILSPFIFVPFFYSPIYGMVSALVFLVATTVPPAAITMTENLQNSLLPGEGNTTTRDNSYMDDYYIKPYNRMGPYIIGMVTGFLLYHTNCSATINKVVNVLCWGVAAAVALAVLYGRYDSMQGRPLTLAEEALYNSVSRTAWAMAVAWVIFACVTGHGGYVNTILSWKALIPLSRLTYSIYLIHIMMMAFYIYTRDTVFYFSDANVVVLFLGILVACYLLSVLVSLTFEAPMIALEKLLLHRSKEE